MTATAPASYSTVQGDGGGDGKIITTGAVVAGDWLIACVGSSSNGETITKPATGTWTEITVTDNSIATGGGQMRAYKCINPASTTAYTWTLTGGRRSIVGLLVRGADASDCVDQKASLESAAGGNSTPPSVTPTAANELVIDFAMMRCFSPDVSDWATPASGLTWTEQKDVQGADGNNNVRLAVGTATAGSSGVAVSTTAWTNSDVSEESMIIRILIKDAAGGGGSVSGTAAAALGAVTATAAGLPTVPGTAAKNLGALAAAAAGTVTHAGTAAAALGRATATATGTPTVPGTAAAALRGLSGTGSGTRTTFGTASAALGGLAGVATQAGTVTGTASASLGGLSAAASGIDEGGEDVAESAGSWYQLLDILALNDEEQRQLSNTPPTACPNDGTPLQTGPNGELHCVFDGWVWSGLGYPRPTNAA